MPRYPLRFRPLPGSTLHPLVRGITEGQPGLAAPAGFTVNMPGFPASSGVSAALEEIQPMTKKIVEQTVDARQQGAVGRQEGHHGGL